MQAIASLVPESAECSILCGLLLLISLPRVVPSQNQGAIGYQYKGNKLLAQNPLCITWAVNCLAECIWQAHLASDLHYAIC